MKKDDRLMDLMLKIDGFDGRLMDLMAD